jgi:hypothetical protein
VYTPRDDAAGIVTRYGLDGPGIESRSRRDSAHSSRPTLGPTQPPMGTGSIPGIKRPGRGVDHIPPSSAEVKERVELHTSTPTQGLHGLLQGELKLFYLLHTPVL